MSRKQPLGEIAMNLPVNLTHYGYKQGVERVGRFSATACSIGSVLRDARPLLGVKRTSDRILEIVLAQSSRLLFISSPIEQDLASTNSAAPYEP
jgi:hypothetical protein